MKQISENGISSSTPELIVRILSKDFPLRINEIHRRLKENHQIDISFQGARKALQILVSSGKLHYKNGEYSLNKEWIKQLKSLSDSLVNNYFTAELKSKPPTIERIGKEFQIFRFKDALQTDKFVGELLFDIAQAPGEKKLCIQMLHYWFPLGHMGTESEFILEMRRRKTEIYYLKFSKSYLLDRLSEKFYSQHGAHFGTTSDELERYSEICSIGDFIIKVQYPTQFIDELDAIYKKTKDIKDFDFKSFGTIIKKELPVTLTIFRDKSIAMSIQEKTLRYYPKSYRQR